MISIYYLFYCPTQWIDVYLDKPDFFRQRTAQLCEMMFASVIQRTRLALTGGLSGNAADALQEIAQ